MNAHFFGDHAAYMDIKMIKFSLRSISLSIIGLLSCHAHAAWQMGGYAQFNDADIKGFQQTPKGGTVESTSPERPTFDELNIKSKNYPTFGLWSAYKAYKLSFDYLPLRLQGETILSSPLVTHAIPIPAGSFFHAETNDDLYILGLSRIFKININWEISPSLKINGLDHHYEFQSGGFSSTRAFFATGLGLGLDTSYVFTNNIELNAAIAVSIPVTSLEVYQAKIALAYRWYPSNNLLIKPYATVGWNKIEFKDNQPIPNYLQFRLSPAWGLGLSLEWFT